MDIHLPDWSQAWDVLQGVGTAWPIIVAVAVVLSAVARWVWRRAAQKRLEARKLRKLIGSEMSKIQIMVQDLSDRFSKIQDLQLEFAHEYGKASSEEKAGLVQKWNIETTAYDHNVGRLREELNATQENVEKSSPIDHEMLDKIRQLKSACQAELEPGRWGPFSSPSSNRWASIVSEKHQSSPLPLAE
ncbi:hypothetical protein IRT45_05870 [Nocardia sp. BSTN01]|uniref:hypothetical protein n=1 Tax=Nocardia sp. BSTN01 TaxID=2783665 RepID=UPI00188F8A3A|nr:hypothetical protein [Nocardia sp. BSTN01]MBF4996681.1 hypothetical protein [Nocardia sp. BSTN01]